MGKCEQGVKLLEIHGCEIRNAEWTGDSLGVE